MGFTLSAKKTTYVSSTIYNLAGDVEDRPNYLKTTVVGKVIADTDSSTSLSEAIQKSYIKGPGMRMRSFIKWAKSSGYNTAINMVETGYYTGNNIDEEVLAKEIPYSGTDTVNIVATEMGVAEWTWWADQYMCEYHSDLINTNWVTDFNEGTNTIKITFEDGTVENFTPVGFDTSANFLYVMYSLTAGGYSNEVITGEYTVLSDSDSFPDVTSWSQGESYSKDSNLTLHRSVVQTISYSDGRPDEVTTGESDSTIPVTTYGIIYTKSEYAGAAITDTGQETHKTLYTQYQEQTATVVAGEPVTDVSTEEVDGVTVTTTTVTTEETKKSIRRWRTDTQDTVTAVYHGSRVYLYKYNSGNSTLDMMFAANKSSGMTAPFIPVRINNVSITDEMYSDIYPLATKAYKKATGAKFSELIEKVEDNENLGDIDYAYVVFGVPLNTKDVLARKYIYKWLQAYIQSNTSATTEWWDYTTKMAEATAINKKWTAWMEAQSDPTNALYGTAEPARIPYPHIPATVSLQQARGIMNYQMYITWNGMSEALGSGMKDADNHPVGDCWFEINPSYEFQQMIYIDSSYYLQPYTTNDLEVEHVTLFYQETATSWRAINIWGFKHTNYVYNGKTIGTTAVEALNDADESPFIIPIERSVLTSTSLVATTQMATVSSIIVFNCYQVVKQKWYQTGLFKVVLVVAIIIIAIYTGGAGVGLLGTASSVGAAVGLTGVAALIVGTLANALAAMIVSKIITYAATRAFGDKVGVIVSAIATVVVMSVGTTMANGGSLAEGFAALASPQNITQLTVAAGNGYAGYMQAAVQETVAETQDMIDAYTDESKSIAEKYNSVIGTNTGIIDPLALTDATQHIYESMNSFMSRTLLTGADIADLSQTLLENFVDITTSTTLDLT